MSCATAEVLRGDRRRGCADALTGEEEPVTLAGCLTARSGQASSLLAPAVAEREAVGRLVDLGDRLHVEHEPDRQGQR